MLYTRKTSKSVERVFEDVQIAIKTHGFGLLHYYDFRKTLHEKGFELAQACLVLEVCNPAQAAEVLGRDMRLNMVLPCRLSIYEDGGKTFIGMLLPTALLGLISTDAAIAEAASGVEKTMQQIIDAAA